MLKLITQAMLDVATALAGGLAKTGERMEALAARFGADEAYDLRAPYSEIWMRNRATNVAAVGAWFDSLAGSLSAKLCS